MNAQGFGPMLVYTAGVFLIVGLMYAVAYVVGERHAGRLTDTPFESGMKPTGTAHLRFSARFYLVAMLFVLFDLEVVFILAWAVAVLELGWPGYMVMLAFALILIVGLAYEWRVGALTWVERHDH